MADAVDPTKCPVCRGPMKPLFQGFFCPNECDLPAEKRAPKKATIATSPTLAEWGWDVPHVTPPRAPLNLANLKKAVACPTCQGPLLAHGASRHYGALYCPACVSKPTVPGPQCPKCGSHDTDPLTTTVAVLGPKTHHCWDCGRVS